MNFKPQHSNKFMLVASGADSEALFFENLQCSAWVVLLKGQCSAAVAAFISRQQKRQYAPLKVKTRSAASEFFKRAFGCKLFRNIDSIIYPKHKKRNN
ncbi:MAG TPA: hypothetical protein VGC97_14645 [Pyrinomonadaceae bacterium]